MRNTEEPFRKYMRRSTDKMGEYSARLNFSKALKPLAALLLLFSIMNVGSTIYYMISYGSAREIDYIEFAVTIVYSVLIFMCIIILHQKRKSGILFPLATFLIAAKYVYYAVELYESSFGWYLQEGAAKEFYIYLFRYIIIAVLMLIISIEALFGFRVKVFTIISTVAIIVYIAFTFCSSLMYAKYVDYEPLSSYYFRVITGSVFGILLPLVLLIFVIGNKTIPVIKFSQKKEVEKLRNMSPERALRTLDKRLDCGEIDVGEYTALRALIISSAKYNYTM